jgi:hypothetical protein
VRRSIRIALCLLACAWIASAGPVDFGMSEYNAALATRGLKWKVTADLSLDPPETFRIEPYRVGGAHITGGDLRGLMYGLIEASEQIRSTGRLAQAHGVPATALRGIRVLAHFSDLEKYPESFWRSYFQMLARDRFNRFTLVFTQPMPYPWLVDVEGFPEIRVPGLTAARRERNLHMLRFISQAAADYAIDFALGIWESGPQHAAGPPVEGLTPDNIGPYSRDALRQLLAACPMIRSVEIRAASPSGIPFDSIFKALHETGRRVTLDPRGSLQQPALLKAAEKEGVALQFPPESWPGGFEIDPPLEPGRWESDGHPLFYWLWGRLGYDPDTKLPKDENLEDYRAAARTIRLLAAAYLSDPGMYPWPRADSGVRRENDTDEQPDDWGFVASLPEALHDRLDRVASAKQTPPEIADLLIAAAISLEKAAGEDFQMLAEMARYHAHQLRADYQNLLGRTADAGNPTPALPPSLKPLPRPRFAHTPVKTILPNQPLTLTLQIGSPQDARTVRLHYRTLDQDAPAIMMEKPAAASVSFTIPGSAIPPGGDLVYYFEILNRANGGWFDPDPLAASPYYVVGTVRQ